MKVSIKRVEMIRAGACDYALKMYDDVSIMKYGRIKKRISIVWDELSKVFLMTSEVSDGSYVLMLGLAPHIAGLELRDEDVKVSGWELHDPLIERSRLLVCHDSIMRWGKVTECVVRNYAVLKNMVVECSKIKDLDGHVEHTTVDSCTVDSMFRTVLRHVVMQDSVVLSSQELKAHGWSADCVKVIKDSILEKCDIKKLKELHRVTAQNCFLFFDDADISSSVIQGSLVSGRFRAEKTVFVGCRFDGFDPSQFVNCKLIGCKLSHDGKPMDASIEY